MLRQNVAINYSRFVVKTFNLVDKADTTGTVDVVDTADTVDTADMVYTDNTVGTVDTIGTADTVDHLVLCWLVICGMEV